MNSRSDYDVAIIGAGLSALAAGIRLAHFGRRVCIFERHNVPGGLNSFYSIAGRKFDVGLHAVTNFGRPGEKGAGLARALRQLRIDRGELEFCEQKQSRIAFGPGGESSLRFTNDFAVLESEVERLFPSQAEGFRALTQVVRSTRLGVDSSPARPVLRRHISDPLLEDMLLCPLLFYGSASEYDMDFSDFAMLYQAVFLEGLARPFAGIRPIIGLLLEKYRGAGGERRMKCGVKRIVPRGGRAAALILDSGEEITATHVLSCIGAPETEALISSEGEIGVSDQGGRQPAAPGASAAAGVHPAGRITFVETMSILNRQPADLGWGGDTIVFFNDSGRFTYAAPDQPVDARSGVICIPNNFDFGPERSLPEGILRATCLANYDRWASLPEEAYVAEKRVWFDRVQASARRFLPALAEEKLAEATVATDMFTPRTVERFTGRRNGAIYGSPLKSRSGTTGLANLYLCGTDQGLIGIVGSMLSGILMANQHILIKSGG